MTATGASRLVTVSLPVPLFRTFAYEVPDELTGRVVVGARVVVPLRGGREIGIVTSLEATLPPGVTAKRILGAPASKVTIPADQGDVNEIYYYQESGHNVAIVRLEAGRVTRVNTDGI